jgi:hypothetical protein
MHNRSFNRIWPVYSLLAPAYQVTSAVWMLAGRLPSRLLQNTTGASTRNSTLLNTIEILDRLVRSLVLHAKDLCQEHTWLHNTACCQSPPLAISGAVLHTQFWISGTLYFMAVRPKQLVFGRCRVLFSLAQDRPQTVLGMHVNDNFSRRRRRPSLIVLSGQD